MFIVILIIKLKVRKVNQAYVKSVKIVVDKEGLAKKWSIIAGKSKSLKAGDWKLEY